MNWIFLEAIFIAIPMLVICQSCTESPSGHYLIKLCDDGTREFAGCLVGDTILHLNESKVDKNHQLTCSGNAKSVAVKATGCVIDGHVVHIGEYYEGKNYEYFCTDSGGVRLTIVGCIFDDMKFNVSQEVVYKHRAYTCTPKGPKVTGCGSSNNTVVKVNQTYDDGNYVYTCSLDGDEITKKISGCIFEGHRIAMNESLELGRFEYSCVPGQGLDISGCVNEGKTAKVNGNDTIVIDPFSYRCVKKAGKINLEIYACFHENVTIPLEESRTIDKYLWKCTKKGPVVFGCLLEHSTLNIDEERIQGTNAFTCSSRGLRISACAFNNATVHVNETYTDGSFEFVCKKEKRHIRARVNACLIQGTRIPAEGSKSIGNYEYTCLPNKGLDITGCSKDNITTEINQTLSDGHLSYLCEHTGKQVQLKLHGCFVEETLILLGEEALIDGINYVCSNKGAEISGCMYDNKQLSVGETTQTEHYVLECRNKKDDSIGLVVTACVHAGAILNVGEGFSQDMNDYLCAKDEIKGIRLIMDGCLIDAVKLKAGDTHVKQSLIYTCTETGPQITGCIRRNQELRIGEKTLEANYELVCHKDPSSGAVAITVFSCLLRGDDGEIDAKIVLGEQLVWEDSLYECAVESIDSIGE